MFLGMQGCWDSNKKIYSKYELIFHLVNLRGLRQLEKTLLPSHLSKRMSNIFCSRAYALVSRDKRPRRSRA